MRILFLSNLYPPHVEGGAEILAGNIASGLERLGHEVFVLTSKEPERRWQRAKSPLTSAGARAAGNWENEHIWHILEYTPTVHFDRRRSLWSQCKKLFNFYRRYHNAANAQKLPRNDRSYLTGHTLYLGNYRYWS